MNIKFLADLRALKAVLTVASDEETRYYLNGVNVEVRKDGVTYCATDGHRLLVARQKGLNPDDVPPFIIPSKLIKSVKLKKSTDLCDITVEGTRVTIHYLGESIGADLIDGTFPDYRRVIPATTNGKHANFNFDYLASFNDAARLFRDDTKSNFKAYPIVHHNGDEPALVEFVLDEREGIEAVGVIMPVRVKQIKFEAPAWAVPAPAKKEEAGA